MTSEALVNLQDIAMLACLFSIQNFDTISFISSLDISKLLIMIAFKLICLMLGTVLMMNTCLGKMITNKHTMDVQSRNLDPIDMEKEEDKKEEVLSGHDANYDVIESPPFSDNENVQVPPSFDTAVANVWGETSLCDVNSIDAAVTLFDDFLGDVNYFFKGSTVFVAEGLNFDGVQEDKISNRFSEGPSSVDAAFTYGDKVLLFQGKKYWQYNGLLDLEKKERNVMELGLKRKRIRAIAPISPHQVNIYYKKKGFSYNPLKTPMEKKLLLSVPSKIAGPDAAIQTCASYCEGPLPIYFFKKSKVYKVNRETMEVNEELDLKTFFQC